MSTWKRGRASKSTPSNSTKCFIYPHGQAKLLLQTFLMVRQEKFSAILLQSQEAYCHLPQIMAFRQPPPKQNIFGLYFRTASTVGHWLDSFSSLTENDCWTHGQFFFSQKLLYNWTCIVLWWFGPHIQWLSNPRIFETMNLFIEELMLS